MTILWPVEDQWTDDAIAGLVGQTVKLTGWPEAVTAQITGARRDPAQGGIQLDLNPN